jgi:adenylate cyclase
MIKKILLNPWTALLTLIVILSVRISDPEFVESVRLRYFDTLISAKPITNNPIYTINIDENSLDKYGQWPFKRDIYSQIVEDLYKHNAGLVVLNILMPETDRQGGDKILAETLKNNQIILPSIPADFTKNTPRITGAAVLGPDYLDRIIQYPGIISNIEILNDKAAGVGTVNTLPEIDGVNRRMPLVVSVKDKLYPSLGLETLRVAAGDTTFQIKLNENGVEKLRIPKFGPITTDNLGRIWIDWSQKSINKGLNTITDDYDFIGGIVIVGPTAAGIGNPIPTANGAIFPHEAQAAVIGTMMNGVFIQRPDYADGEEVLVLLITGTILLFLTRWIYIGLASIIALSVGAVFASHYVFLTYLYLFDITAFVSGIVLVGLHAYGVKFLSEFFQKQQIKKQFGTYLSPALVEKLQKNPELLTLGGESRELSIMFTDVRGFTSISEHYGKNVQGLTQIMNRYMTAMTAKIIENDGTLDKYIGDAQMAFWNAPLDDPDHAKHAVKTALQMLINLKEFNDEIEKEGVPAFGMGLGINTDTVVVGNMGSNQRFDYTCLGDGVNLASRLEGQSKPYGVKIVLGTKTADYIKDEYFIIELDKIAVKGKKEGVHIFTVLSHLDDFNHDDYYYPALSYHNQMLNAYRSKHWDVASEMCKQLLCEFDGDMDHYYEMMIDRIAEYKNSNSLPKVWDGTFVATSK